MGGSPEGPRYELFTVLPTRSTPRWSEGPINGTRAVLGSGSCLGKGMNEGIDLKSVYSAKPKP
jgi:hypothetical protein